jgi:DNA-binding response OmpR family regulator
VSEKLNFSKISAVVVDSDRYSSAIIGQILRGFGMQRFSMVATIEDAKKLLATGGFHLLITESVVDDGALPELVNWVRHHAKTEIRFIPIVVLSSYTYFSRVTLARDSGVNSVVCKPVSPTVLFDHIAWSANTERPFIDADAYAGPCRRFRFGDPAPGFSRRISDHPPGTAMPDEIAH